MKFQWHPLGSSRRVFCMNEHKDDEHFEFLMTDGKTCFKETLTAEEVRSRNGRLNPAVEASAGDLIPEIVQILSKNTTSLDLLPSELLQRDDDEDGIDPVLKIRGKLYNYDFQWHFDLTAMGAEELFEILSSSLLNVLSAMFARQDFLVDLLKKKDLEIFDYSQSGATLSRNSLKTEKFDLAHLKETALPSTPSSLSLLTTEPFHDIQKCIELSESHADQSSDPNPSPKIRIRGEKVGQWKYNDSESDSDDHNASVSSKRRRPQPTSAPVKVSAKASLAKKLKKI
ncbi:non-homologous end-joining factor 1-like [Tigriopus californicus]|uniref:non-homologous end-joining factor 1-like n=1 Tax=Tigriopus californicus TaxID=6832 RepID=UPI0027DA236F|nr:non-homologous end-joining factor 1-like [Tigriopus californicus]|eukprot:TCALIF_04919-PA protein Name:"Similar to nhej1 Non-homologous end-joining factor 1 (Danio rerio)" AED:0.93 eAED:0.93 QI:0/-1/0/1/-1/1/1/0/284